MNSERALHFKKTRQERYSEVAEDYTEMIADYIETKGSIRVCDIAKEMGVSHVSVLKTIKKLTREGLVVEDSLINLTPKGKEMAVFSKRKHLALLSLLLKLGVPKDVAECDVEGIEHHISQTTLNAIEKFNMTFSS